MAGEMGILLTEEETEGKDFMAPLNSDSEGLETCISSPKEACTLLLVGIGDGRAPSGISRVFFLFIHF